MPALRDSQVYYFELGEGRWEGKLSFTILDVRGFLRAKISPREKALAVLLHALGRLPGKTVMRAEILGAPDEGDGVARVEVSVYRFGMEVSRLRGHYALDEGGHGVRIHITQRYGPHGFPWEDRPGRAVISHAGRRAQYDMKLLGEDFEGHYLVAEDRLHLDARYASAWAEVEEVMTRACPLKPTEPQARARCEALLELARDIEARCRDFDLRQDPRAVFAHVYAYFLRDLAYGLHEQGFEDPDWVVRLGKAFAQRYDAAMQTYGQGGAPWAWCEAIDLMLSGKLTVVDELLISMGVHIGHDLPRALAQVGLTTPDGRSRIADFHRVNLVLERAIDPIQDRLAERYNPIVGVVDRVLGGMDEEIARAGIRSARGRAWYDAELLRHPESGEETAKDIDARVGALCRLLLGRPRRHTLPRRLFRRAVRTLRRHPRHAAAAEAFYSRCADGAHNLTVPAWAQAALGAHTRRAANASRLLQDNLRHFLQNRPLDSLLTPGDVRRLGAAVDGEGWWANLPRAAEERPDTKVTLAALVADLPEPIRSEGLRALGVREGAALRAVDVQEALVEVLRRGFDAARARLSTAVDALDAAGLPAGAVLTILDDPNGGYDPDTRVFTAKAAAVFDVDLEAVRWMLSPDRWDDAITPVEETHWVDAPVNGGGVFYERVNLFYPYLTHHPLALENLLFGRVVHEADQARTEYALKRSLDDVLDVDEGYLLARTLAPGKTVVVLEKRLRVYRNPTLYTLLRCNPDGLSFMLAQWLQDAALTHPGGAQSS
ncbi:MAG: hypothetical protein H6730_15220 [Deltaproteobacteria bacterium]|nr:hypothetical protein [Deltaproteobacteria bacterium]